MKTILIVNPKGGSGKTTVATNLAGYFASSGDNVLLFDMDRQRSATGWLERRPEGLPDIHSWNSRSQRSALGKAKPDWLVVDTPAGMHGAKLADAIQRADRVVVPVQPSAFDMGAASEFMEILHAERKVRRGKVEVAVIGMRVDLRTRSALALEAFLEETEFPVLTYLRDAQVYVQAAEEGLSLFDMPPYRAEHEMGQWQPLLEWLAK